FVALHDALSRLMVAGELSVHPLSDHCAAVSVGIVDGECRLDLPYIEDSAAEVDMNVVMSGSGGFIEVQGTAEGQVFDRAQLTTLIDLASAGIADIVDRQKALLATPPASRVAGS
ncbi:MAG: ribonuclease PH, partial [Acidimicrobiia bacterium]|nr:ribonuclease PH [Acidimicrobiia bacterium]